MENEGRDISGDTTWKWLRQAVGKDKGDGEELWIQQTLLKETAGDFPVDDKWDKGKEDLNIPILPNPAKEDYISY